MKMLSILLLSALLLSSCSTTVELATGDDPLLVVRQTQTKDGQNGNVSSRTFFDNLLCTGPRPSVNGISYDLERELIDDLPSIVSKSRDVDQFSILLIRAIEVVVKCRLRRISKDYADDREWVKMEETALWRAAVNVYFYFMWHTVRERYHKWPKKKPGQFDQWPDYVKQGIEQGWSQRKQAQVWPHPFNF